mgnify:CR=1 FL=1
MVVFVEIGRVVTCLDLLLLKKCADRTIKGGALKILTLVDEYTRECHVIHVERRIRARDVRRQLERLIR